MMEEIVKRRRDWRFYLLIIMRFAHWVECLVRVQPISRLLRLMFWKWICRWVLTEKAYICVFFEWRLIGFVQFDLFLWWVWWKWMSSCIHLFAICITMMFLAYDFFLNLSSKWFHFLIVEVILWVYSVYNFTTLACFDLFHDFSFLQYNPQVTILPWPSMWKSCVIYRKPHGACNYL